MDLAGIEEALQGGQVKAAEAQLTRLRVQLQSERLSQEATTASLKSDHIQSKLEAEADAILAKDGLVAGLMAGLPACNPHPARERR